MNRFQYAKILGMIGAFAAAGVSYISGDAVTAIGLIAAAFSSPTISKGS